MRFTPRDIAEGIRLRELAQAHTMMTREASALRRRLHGLAARDGLDPHDIQLLIALDRWTVGDLT